MRRGGAVTSVVVSVLLLVQQALAGTHRITIPGGGIKRTVNGAVERLTVIPDHQGGARLVLNGATVVEKVSYEPYGRTLEDTPDSTKTTRKYTGQEKDDSTGLYNYNARLYDPAAGLFISADTIIPNPVSPHTWNRYAYCHGDPVNLIDPSGHDAGPKGPGGHGLTSGGYWPAPRPPEKFWKDIDPACTTKALDASRGSDTPFGDDPYGMPFPPTTPFQDHFSWCVAELPYAERTAIFDRYEASPERQRVLHGFMSDELTMHDRLVMNSDQLVANAPQMIVGVVGVVVAGAKLGSELLGGARIMHSTSEHTGDEIPQDAFSAGNLGITLENGDVYEAGVAPDGRVAIRHTPRGASSSVYILESADPHCDTHCFYGAQTMQKIPKEIRDHGTLSGLTGQLPCVPCRFSGGACPSKFVVNQHE